MRAHSVHLSLVSLCAEHGKCHPACQGFEEEVHSFCAFLIAPLPAPLACRLLQVLAVAILELVPCPLWPTSSWRSLADDAGGVTRMCAFPIANVPSMHAGGAVYIVCAKKRQEKRKMQRKLKRERSV